MAREFRAPLRYPSDPEKLPAAIEANRRELETFLNTEVVRREVNGTVNLPANSTVATVAISTTAHVHAQDDLSDTVVTTPADNSVLAYDTASSKWIDQTAAEALLATTTHAASHQAAGTDEVDGDKIDIDWNPATYVPTDVTETDDTDDLSAHLAGIDLALFHPRVRAFTLTDKTIFTAVSAWEAWGAASHLIGTPARAVWVDAHITADALVAAGVSRAAKARIGISLDNGGVWSDGTGQYFEINAASTRRCPVVAGHFVSGTATGNVLVRAEALIDGGAITDMDFLSGILHVTMGIT